MCALGWFELRSKVLSGRKDLLLVTFGSMKSSDSDHHSVVPGPGRHIPALDGIRGLAILMVIWFHLFQMIPELSQISPRVLSLTSRLGQNGVDLFFVLSGFLITGILLDTREKPRYFQNFFARRTLRIFPLYYLTLLLAMGATWAMSTDHRGAASDWWMWTYLSNVPPTFSDRSVAYPHFWSLAVEEQFYLVWPILIWFCGMRYTKALCIACIVAAPVSRWWLVENGYSGFYLMPCRMDALACGGLLAVLLRTVPDPRRLKKPFLLAAAAALLVGAVLFPLVSGKGIASVQVLKHTLPAVLSTSLVGLTVISFGNSPLNRVFSLKSLQTIGQISYCLYLVHPFLIELTQPMTLNVPAQSVHRLVLTRCAIIVVGSVLLSLLSRRFVERPFLSLKRYFDYL